MPATTKVAIEGDPESLLDCGVCGNEDMTLKSIDKEHIPFERIEVWSCKNGHENKLFFTLTERQTKEV